MDAQQPPLDRTSAAALAAEGLRLGLVDTTSREELAAWAEADHRGFHDRRPDPELVDEDLSHASHRRITGVWDETIPEPAVPVATVSSWVAELTVPGGGTPHAWAISSVTVAPTHRRRGVARALIEGELRTAASAGVPIAALTVSEATIYERYGFGPATQTAELTIDTRRAGWAHAPASTGRPGRLGFVSLRTAGDTGRDVFDRARRATPGELSVDDLVWGRLTGVLGDRDKASSALRAVRYDDASGTPQGLVVYSVKADAADFAKHTVEVRYLRAATDEAHAALWRYLLGLDLVSTLRHETASPDEPVLWMIRDQRAATAIPRDHHWLRILDVVTALAARRYASPVHLVLRVEDRLGLADGSYLLDVPSEGPIRIERTDDTPDITLDVATLSALYLGAWRAPTLARAGRLAEHTPGALTRLDVAFRSAQAPWLSYWY